MGTLDYIAPEQVQDLEESCGSDVYALAAMLYECLTGSVPFPKRTQAALIFAHISQPPPRVTERRPELPRSLDEVIARGMAKDCDERFPTAAELLRAASDALAGGPALGPPPPVGSPEEAGVRAGDGTASAATALRRVTTAARRDGHRPPPPPRTAAAGERVRAPEETARLPARRATPTRMAVAAAVGVAVAAAGFGIGRAVGGDEVASPGPGSFASAGSVGVTFPAGWERLSELPPVERVRFEDGVVAAAPAGRAGERAVVVGLRAAIGSSPRRGRVRLGDHEAYRADVTSPGADGTETQLHTIYSVPTTRGVATVACIAPLASAGTFSADCERVASTLELSGAEPFPLGPSKEYANVLDALIGRLNRERDSRRSRLARARTAAGQSRAARDLATAYSAAASALRRLDLSPEIAGVNAALAAALGDARDAYRRMSSAARRQDAGGFDGARKAARAADAGISRILTGDLRTAGYSLR